MYFNYLNQQNQISAITPHQEALHTAQPVQTKTNGFNIPEYLIAEGSSILAFFIFWTGFLMVMSKLVKGTANNQPVCTANPIQNHRCSKCQYFSKNHFLQCAVQPSLVLTADAINCSDFCPTLQKENSTAITKFKFWK